MIERDLISNQSFADDTQLLDFCPLDHFGHHCQTYEHCISAVKLWMDCNKLKLNDDKTESILIKSDKIMLPVPASIFIPVRNYDIPVASHARNFGITISSNTTMDNHVTNNCRSAYAEQRRRSSIRHLLTVSATKTPLSAFLLSKFRHARTLGIPFVKTKLLGPKAFSFTDSTQ